MLLAREILVYYEPEELPEAIYPIPLHESRLRERGFNQSAEIVRTLSACLKIPQTGPLVHKIRATPSQVGLGSGARLKNMRSSFIAGDTCAYRSVALVDDVLTSGATAMAVARCLPRKTRLHLWCLARAV
jgi:predicted amidophosphoribosyltransferase